MRIGYWLAVVICMALFGWMPVAGAQDDPQPSRVVSVPADQFVMAAGGVDLRSGRYVYSNVDLAIGGVGQPSSLTLLRTMADTVTNHYNPFGNFSSNWEMMITVVPYDVNSVGSATGFRAEVRTGGRALTFDSLPGQGYAFKSGGDDATLSYTGGTQDGASTVYTYTASDGTIAVFRPLGASDCATGGACAYVSKLTEPDGTVFTFSYSSTGDFSRNQVRLASVVSSRGFGLVLEGTASSVPGYGSRITKACVVNLTQTTKPASGMCPATAPSTSYAYDAANPQRLASMTDVAGKVWSFGYEDLSSGYNMKFYKPGQSTPWLINTLAPTADEDWQNQDVVNFQTFADGRTYAYFYGSNPSDAGPWGIAGGGYVDNLGVGRSAPFGFPIKPGTGPGSPCNIRPCSPVTMTSIVYQQTAGPVSLSDELGRTTILNYCNQQALIDLPAAEHNRCIVEQLQWFTDPEGIKTMLTYSGRNVTQVRRIAKPGSGLADIVTSAAYGCVGAKCSSKPTSQTDAKGNVTTYTYDPAHGGMLTMTLPAAAVNGIGTPIAPVKRYGYTLRRAWVSNGSGGYVQNTDGVYLLTSEKTCRTTATNIAADSCAGGAADEVVTIYDYGPDSGPNNLLLRGTTVTAYAPNASGAPVSTTLRSCFGYDSLGNKISETKPRAGLTVCP
jgi:YD repeat-containing protein